MSFYSPCLWHFKVYLLYLYCHSPNFKCFNVYNCDFQEWTLEYYIHMYLVISVVGVIAAFLGYLMLELMSLKAAKTLYNNMLHKLVSAPLRLIYMLLKLVSAPLRLIYMLHKLVSAPLRLIYMLLRLVSAPLRLIYMLH